MSYKLKTKRYFDLCSVDKSIVCFGYGRIYKTFLDANPEYKDSIIAVIDNDKKKQENDMVYGIEYLLECPEKIVILITSIYYEDIKKQLMEISIPEDMIFCYPFEEDYVHLSTNEKMANRVYKPARKMVHDYSRQCKWERDQLNEKLDIIDYSENKNGIVIPYCTFLVTNACTLNCRDCNNLMPFYSERFFASYNSVKKDLDSLLSVIDHCVVVNFTGGEPFLNRELADIVDYTVKNKKISVVEVITNGTIIPSDELKSALTNKKVIVKISNYNGFSKLQELKRVLNQANIRYDIYDDLVWVRSGGIQRRNKEKERLQSEYMKCWAGMFCKSVLNGKLYHCARAAFLDNLNVDLDEDDCLNLSEIRLEERIKDFYIRSYADACDFCDHHNVAGGKIPAAIQLKKVKQ